MNLKLISQTVARTCDAIANVLDVDVIVVDHNLDVIGNTYKYMVENDINVSKDSIMASSILDNVNKLVMDIKSNQKCLDCNSRDLCKIKGVIAIPIRNDNCTLGAIGIMLSMVEDVERFSKDMDAIISFLENMSELLISKLISVNQVNRIEVINNEIEHIITNVKDGILYLDKDNKVAYFNQVFIDYFKINNDIKGQAIDEILNHTIIKNYLFNKKNISDEVFVLQNSRVSFKGLISCINTNMNSEYLGSLLTFRKIEETFRVMNEMLNNKSTVAMKHLISDDPDIQKEIDKAKEVAITEDHLLITGELGTGKKTLAYSIHNFSRRKSNYVITIDCKFLPRDYYLSELFGIGQSKINPGMMQLADKGTIIFDEITNLPLSIQLDLLNYIDTGKIELEKGIVIKDINVRIIATTQQNIKSKIKQGFFNEELYYRISSNTFNLKRLNARIKVDCEQFVNRIIKTYSRIFSKHVITIDQSGLDMIYKTTWHNNIIGLEMFFEQLIYDFDEEVITGEVIANEISRLENAGVHAKKILSYDDYEKDFIENALTQYAGVKNKIDIVADKLGIGRATLYRKINKYGLM